MTVPDIEAAQLFDAMSSAAFLVSLDGTVISANRASRALLRLDMKDRPAAELNFEDPRGFSEFLSRCSGSKDATLGRLAIVREDGSVERQRVKGRLLRPALKGRSALVCLECTGAHEQFSLLADRIRELNEEMHARRRIQAVLEEAVGQRDVLMRELHHRVRNNLQMIAGMLKVAGSEADSPDAQRSLSEAASRVAAVSSVQQALYTGQMDGFVSASKLLTELCTSLGSVAGQAIALNCHEDTFMPSEVATPLAMIANELLTNAIKYGKVQDGCIRVTLVSTPSDLVLSVHDNGPGFEVAGRGSKRASGLGLVRGLLRQVGGSWAVTNESGAKCMVTVPLKSTPQAIQS